MINWKVRIKNKNFWIALIPAILLLVQVVAAVFGVTVDLGELGNKLLAVVNALFAVLAILGIVTDPTTEGVADSTRARTYDVPKPKTSLHTTALRRTGYGLCAVFFMPGERQHFNQHLRQHFIFKC